MDRNERARQQFRAQHFAAQERKIKQNKDVKLAQLDAEESEALAKLDAMFKPVRSELETEVAKARKEVQQMFLPKIADAVENWHNPDGMTPDDAEVFVKVSTPADAVRHIVSTIEQPTSRAAVEEVLPAITTDDFSEASKQVREAAAALVRVADQDSEGMPRSCSDANDGGGPWSAEIIGVSGTTLTWVVDPVLRCVNYIAEEVKLASVLYHAVFAFGSLEPILKAAGQQLRQARQSDVAINKLIDANKTLGQWARDVVKDDYHAITVHSLIGLWTTVEVAVEDTATLILMNDPAALSLVEEAGVRLRKPPPTPLNEAGARRVYTAFERRSREGRSVARGYGFLLSILGVTVTITPETAATLAELNYVRNCFLHRGGVVDERATSEAPDLGVSPGDKIRISESQSKQYLKGVGDFANALLQGALKSRYSPVPRS